MASAPSTAFERLQTPIVAGLRAIESWLEAERDHLALWLPVMLGAGIAAWFVLPDEQAWGWVIGAGLVMALPGALCRRTRTGQALLWAGLMLALGCALVWVRAEMKAHPVVARPFVADVTGVLESVDLRPAQGKVRLVVRPSAILPSSHSRSPAPSTIFPAPSSVIPAKAGIQDLPSREFIDSRLRGNDEKRGASDGERGGDDDAAELPLIRITAKLDQVPDSIAKGAAISLRARLAPPQSAALPGGYDFARAAWFMGLGGTGVALGPVKADSGAADPGLRARLSAHVRAQITGSPGGIAAAFASGDRGGIDPVDEEAMRDSGLTHLLSISGLHITAVIAAAMFLALRVLALSPRLALNWPLLTVSAGIGAATGVGYTLLTGAEVPTVRSCIAALLVLGGMALGREALTLRLVATGALIILILWPESLIGASFQLSFAAITAIVAFHENRRVKAWLAHHEEDGSRRFGRALAGLLVTGLVVELALAPIALFHFHKSGLYGALANMVAIPWTTFVIMPLEALALLFDAVALGAPFWWLCGQAIALLLWLAHQVAAWPGAVASMASIPDAAYALMLGGGLWMLLWTQRPRWLGALPFAAGALWALSVPPPDILITGDGRHMAVRTPDGRMALLRERAGDFVRSALADRAGEEEDLPPLDAAPNARCGPDMCLADVTRSGVKWRVGATRSAQMLPWKELVALCPQLDLIVSDRRLPPGCTPRGLKMDRPALADTGGLAITLGRPVQIEQVQRVGDAHPWARDSADSRRDELISLVAPAEAGAGLRVRTSLP